jgi:hypothetical protein
MAEAFAPAITAILQGEWHVCPGDKDHAALPDAATIHVSVCGFLSVPHR